jgi:hypothetical protein
VEIGGSWSNLSQFEPDESFVRVSIFFTETLIKEQKGRKLVLRDEKWAISPGD